MSLRQTLKTILDLLSEHPNAEHQSSLNLRVTDLQNAAIAFQDALERSNVENSMSYAKLAGLVNDPAKKKKISLNWANAHLERLRLPKLTGKSLNAAAKAQFLNRIVTAKKEEDIIGELSLSEEDKLQDKFAEIAKLSEPQTALNQLKGAKLEEFCIANSVPLAKKKPNKAGKSLSDREKTVRNIIEALENFRERQKL